MHCLLEFLTSEPILSVKSTDRMGAMRDQSPEPVSKVASKLEVLRMQSVVTQAP